MIRRLFPLVLLLVASWGCTQKETAQPPVDFTGNWLSKEYVEQLRQHHSPKQLADNATFYVTEMVIDPRRGDSIIVYNGQQGYSVLPFERRGDTLRLKLNKDPHTDITYDPEQKTLVFTDKTLNRVFRFSKADSTDVDITYDVPIAFPTVVNNATISGTWDFFEHNSTQKVVQFAPNGQVKGWNDYGTYTVCTNGDCAVNNDGDVLVLTTGDKVHAYGFRSKGDTLTVFDLKPATDGGYTNGQPLGLFVRQ